MKRKLILIIFLLGTFTVWAQKPRLVVTVVIEQMRYDYLTRYWERFSNSGFKRLYNQGVVFAYADYKYLNINKYASVTNLATGTNPYMHGIIDKQWYNRTEKDFEDAVFDETYKTVGTKYEQDGASPKKILTSTFIDQLELSTLGLSKTIVIAPDKHSAVLASGMMCDQAYWFDTKSGNWVTSSFYTAVLPQWVKDFNRRKFPDIYLSNTWELSMMANKYAESMSDDNLGEKGLGGQNTFPYKLSSLKNPATKYEMFASTPFFNTFTKDFALSAIVREHMGKDKYTDYLFVVFGANANIANNFGIRSVEIEDAYIKLDKDIAHLLTALDDLVGKDQYIVVLTSDRGACDNPAFVKSLGFDVNFYNNDKMSIILETYLHGLYKSYGLVDKVVPGQVYLSQRLVEKQHIDWLRIESDAMNIMSQFSQVQNVVPSHLIYRSANTNGLMYKAFLNYNPKRSGDILFTLALHSYLENRDKTLPSLSECYCSCNNKSHVPLIFYGNNIKHKVVYRSVDVTSLAPTLSALLRIALPEQSTAPVLDEVLR